MLQTLSFLKYIYGIIVQLCNLTYLIQLPKIILVKLILNTNILTKILNFSKKN